MEEFVSFPKVPRLCRDIVITEKIDGTNAQIYITEGGEFLTGSRNRWITPEQDNHGFAKWALANKEELMTLGVGRHYGEWWGQGIQRGYGLDHKRFSLFNVSKWADDNVRPSCCHVVPVIYEGPFDTNKIEVCIWALEVNGSLAAKGFKNPEGIIVYHTAANRMFKRTIESDGKPKSIA